MASNIDPTKPQTGRDQPVTVIRDNFAAAKAEIEALPSKTPFNSSVGGIPIFPSFTTTEILAITPNSAKGGMCFSTNANTLVWSNGTNWIRLDNGSILS